MKVIGAILSPITFPFLLHKFVEYVKLSADSIREVETIPVI